MNSSENIPILFRKEPFKRIAIHIRGLGHVPSHKNRKMICRKRLITAPKYKARMDAIILSIESQLLGLYRTRGEEITTECSLPHWIVSYLPLDDSLDWMPHQAQSVEYVSKGQEGCNILIERL